jgi:hypothetical protein
MQRRKYRSSTFWLPHEVVQVDLVVQADELVGPERK